MDILKGGNHMKTFNVDMRKVKETAYKKYMNLQDLAIKSHVSAASLFAYQAKRRKASERTVYKIAAALDVSPADIIEK